MKFQHNIITGTLKAAALLLIGIVGFQGFSQHEALSVCEAREKQEEKEVEEFIRGYYRALSEKSNTSLGDYITEEEDLEMEILYKEVLFEYGFVRYDITDVMVWPLSDHAHWLVFVNSEMIVEDLDAALPGANTYLAGRNQDGNLYMDDNSSGDLEQDLIQEVQEIIRSDEIADRSNDIAVEYNWIIDEDTKAAEWVQEVRNAQTRALSEAYTRKEYMENNGHREESGYLVKKGDSLWSIAENELGDGLYWNGIYETNREVIGDNPDLLYVGITLKISQDKKK